MEVKIPKDIRMYQEKVFFGMSIRQNISMGLALGIDVPLYYVLTTNGVNEELVSWTVIAIGMLFLSIGFFSYNGMTVERFVVQYIKTQVWWPMKRTYQSVHAWGGEWDELVQSRGKKK